MLYFLARVASLESPVVREANRMRCRVLALCLLLSLAACVDTPAGPSVVPASPLVDGGVWTGTYNGDWTGTYKMTACSGERHCGQLEGKTHRFSLSLRQTGNDFEGTFRTINYTNTGVAGSVRPDGALVLAQIPGVEGMAHLELRLDRRAGLAGTFDATTPCVYAAWACWGPVFKESGEMVSAELGQAAAPW
jgi:hypothetical protein